MSAPEPLTKQLELLVKSVGDTTAGDLTANVQYYWDLHESVGATSTRLRLLYVKRDLIDLAMGEIRNAVNYRAASPDVAADLSDQFEHLMLMRAEVVAEIDGASALPESIGPMPEGTAPALELTTEYSTSFQRPDGAARADSLRFRGSPYQPSRGRR